MSDAPEFKYRADYEDWMLAMLNPRRNGPNFRALVRAFAAACQLTEDLIWDVNLSTMLDSASGLTLVHAGRKVGEELGELDEVEFKRIIRARLRINQTSGSPDDLCEIYQALTGAGEVTYYGGPASFVIVAYRDSFMRDAYARRVVTSMRLAKPAGIHMQLVEALLPAETFTYDVGPGYGVGRYSRVING